MEKKSAIIIDLDGTLCNNDHRQHFITPPCRNWDEFNANCHKDTINKWCLFLVQRMKMHHEIIFVTGRHEGMRSVTEAWLENHNLETHTLLMRKAGDFRADTIIKEELYREHIEPRYNVLFCIDDRPSVCRMWRGLGLVVLQCDDKEF